jgi:hypothetical protein
MKNQRRRVVASRERFEKPELDTDCEVQLQRVAVKYELSAHQIPKDLSAVRSPKELSASQSPVELPATPVGRLAGGARRASRSSRWSMRALMPQRHPSRPYVAGNTIAKLQDF